VLRAEVKAKKVSLMVKHNAKALCLVHADTDYYVFGADATEVLSAVRFACAQQSGEANLGVFVSKDAVDANDELRAMMGKALENEITGLDYDMHINNPFLLEAYRLAYEAIGDASKDVKSEWLALTKKHPVATAKIAQIAKPPDSVTVTVTALIGVIAKLASVQIAIPSVAPDPCELCELCEKDSIDKAFLVCEKDCARKKLAEDLVELCQKDAVDKALLLILIYKLRSESHSAHAICEYQKTTHGFDSGWPVVNTFAIHHVLEHLKQSKLHARRLFLFEVFLREGTSTQKLRNGWGGWGTSSQSDNVWESAVNAETDEALELCLQFGVDTDVNAECQDNDSRNSYQSVSYSMWRPIHKAIQNGNFDLVGKMLKAGGKIHYYWMKYYRHDRDGGSEQQFSTLYLLYKSNRTDSNHEMLKFLLKHCDWKVNGIPDANKYSLYRGDEDSKDDYDDYEEYADVYHFETMIHVAVERCDIEMIKLLLVYGADPNMVRVKSTTVWGQANFLMRLSGSDDYYVSPPERRRRISGMDEAQRCQAMREFCDKFKAKTELEKREEVLDVYQILERADCEDESVKKQIRSLLVSNRILFPELFEYYPRDQGKALIVIYESLEQALPEPIVGIIAKFFYTVHAVTDASDV